MFAMELFCHGGVLPMFAMELFCHDGVLPMFAMEFCLVLPHLMSQTCRTFHTFASETVCTIL